MSEARPETTAASSRTGLLRWVRSGVAFAVCATLLTVAVFATSRYAYNRRVMNYINQKKPVHGEITWKGPSFNWLKKIIRADVEQALLCRPAGLAVGGTDAGAIDEQIQALLEQLPHLESFGCYICNLPPAWLERLATRHHRVSELTFSLSAITRKESQLLSRMKQLTSIDFTLDVQKPCDNDWSWLTALPNLKSLSITLRGVDDRDLIAVARCPALTKLALRKTKHTDAGIAELTRHSRLTELVIERSDIRLRLPEGIRLPATLQSLELEELPHLDDESMLAIAGLPALNRLIIHGGTLSGSGLSTIAALPALTMLTLDNVEGIADADLERLASSKSLTTISVWCADLTPRCLVHLMKVPNWNHLRYQDVTFSRQPGETIIPPKSEDAEALLAQQREVNRRTNPNLGL